VKHPARWHGDRDPLTHWHGDRDPFTHWRPPWLWRRGSGGPLRRDPADRLAGGVASGIAAWRGLSATTVRIVFVLLALVSLGWAVPAYVLAWLLIPAAGQDTSIGSRARSDSRGIALAAAREATVNAAKWSGASVISLFAEVEPGEVSLVVRDRGQGFDPEAVPEDRKGLAESIHGRMARRGGTATVSTAPGEGTKVLLKMPRAVAQPAGRT